MKFFVISGVVADTEIWSETRVRGTTSGFSVNGVGGSMGTRTSSARNHTRMWIRTDDNREVPVLSNPDWFSVRAGHRVSMLAANKGDEPAKMAAGFNHTTGTEYSGSGTPFIAFAVVIFILFSWFPLITFGLSPVVGTVLSVLFIAMLVRLVFTGASLNSSINAFKKQINTKPDGQRPV